MSTVAHSRKNIVANFLLLLQAGWYGKKTEEKMNATTMSMPLSDRRYVTVSRRDGEDKINVREYVQYGVGGRVYPSIRGLFLTKDIWAEIMAVKEEVAETLNLVQAQELVKGPTEMVDGEPVMDNKEQKEEICRKWHVAGNVFITVETGWLFVNLRRWWLPPESEDSQLVPTKRGLCLHPEEWSKLIGYSDKLEKLILGLAEALPHCLRRDHQNKLTRELCSHCNPTGSLNKL